MVNGSEISVESCSAILKHITISVVLNDGLGGILMDNIWSELPSEYRVLGPISADEEISSFLSSFLFVAESGGFMIEGNVTGKKLVENVVFHEVKGKVLAVEYDESHVNLKSWNVFCNAMNGIFLFTNSAGKITVHERGRENTKSRFLEINPTEFPEALEHVPFDVVFDNPWDYRSMRRILIVFEAGLSEEHFDKLCRRVDAWSLLLEDMGFSDDPSNEVIVEDIESVDERSYEIVLPRFESSEQAWNPLINILARFSTTLALVKKLTIT